MPASAAIAPGAPRAWPRGRGSAGRPRRSARRRATEQRVGLVAGEAGRRGDALGEEAEAARDQRRLRARAPPSSAPASARPGSAAPARRSSASSTAAGRPFSSATRAISAASKSSSPRIAASVIAATSALSPAKSASSSMHSTPMIVESMSAISSRLRRPAAGTTLASHPGTAKPVGQRPVEARPRPRSPPAGAARRRRARAASAARVGHARRGGQDQDRGRPHAQTAARRACRRWCSISATRKASSSACAAFSRGSQAVW